jgi:hypothetical protein
MEYSGTLVSTCAVRIISPEKIEVALDVSEIVVGACDTVKVTAADVLEL